MASATRPRHSSEYRFWTLMCTLAALVFLLFYVLWLQRQREQRLQVTVDIVLQLINSRNFARFHNLRVIKIHNDLVGRLNDQYERELRENGDGPREIDGATLPTLSFWQRAHRCQSWYLNSGPKLLKASSPKRQATFPRWRQPANLVSSLPPLSSHAVHKEELSRQQRHPNRPI